MIEELNKRRSEKESIQMELEKYKESDPEVLKKIGKEANEAKEAANRWTGKYIFLHKQQLHKTCLCRCFF